MGSLPQGNAGYGSSLKLVAKLGLGKGDGFHLEELRASRNHTTLIDDIHFLESDSLLAIFWGERCSKKIQDHFPSS